MGVVDCIQIILGNKEKESKMTPYLKGKKGIYEIHEINEENVAEILKGIEHSLKSIDNDKERLCAKSKELLDKWYAYPKWLEKRRGEQEVEKRLEHIAECINYFNNQDQIENNILCGNINKIEVKKLREYIKSYQNNKNNKELIYILYLLSSHLNDENKERVNNLFGAIDLAQEETYDEIKKLYLYLLLRHKEQEWQENGIFLPSDEKFPTEQNLFIIVKFLEKAKGDKELSRIIDNKFGSYFCKLYSFNIASIGILAKAIAFADHPDKKVIKIGDYMKALHCLSWDPKYKKQNSYYLGKIKLISTDIFNESQCEIDSYIKNAKTELQQTGWKYSEDSQRIRKQIDPQKTENEKIFTFISQPGQENSGSVEYFYLIDEFYKDSIDLLIKLAYILKKDESSVSSLKIGLSDIAYVTKYVTIADDTLFKEKDIEISSKKESLDEKKLKQFFQIDMEDIQKCTKVENLIKESQNSELAIRIIKLIITGEDTLKLAKAYAIQQKSEYIEETHLQEMVSLVEIYDEELKKEIKPEETQNRLSTDTFSKLINIASSQEKMYPSQKAKESAIYKKLKSLKKKKVAYI